MNTFRAAYLRYGLVAVIVLASLSAWLPVNSVSGTDAGISSALTPVPPTKNSAPSGLDSAPSSSNSLAAALAASGSPLACGDSGDVSWTTTSTTFQVMRQCTLSVPQAGWVFFSVDGSLAHRDGEYEAQFEIGIDATIGDSNIDRRVNVYNDAGDGTDRSFALSVLKPVTAGTHTFYSLGRRSAGAGTVMVYDPTLTAIFIPASNSQVLACGASGNLDWKTTSDSFGIIRQCALTAPRAGWVFLSADGSLARLDGEYEAHFNIGIDDATGGDTDIDRWINMYNDAGDGSDKSVALSVLKPVSAGAHTFYSLGRRSAGAGTVMVYDPTLTAIFIPAPSSQMPTCGASGNLNWTTASDFFEVIRQCTLTVSQAGWVFLSANGTVGLQDGEYEALFEIGIDDATAGDHNIDRWVNVYNDTGDGTDETIALSVLRPISAGTHTFYFLGRRNGGTGTVRLYDPTLTVIVVPEIRIYLPLVKK